MPAKTKQKPSKSAKKPKEATETTAPSEPDKTEAGDGTSTSSKAKKSGSKPKKTAKGKSSSKKSKAAPKEEPETTASSTSAEPPQGPPISFKADQADVRDVPLDRLDLNDGSFCFRAALRVGPLKTSLAELGLQIPVVVRRIEGTHRYQLISGFRRATAASELGWKTIPAIVRRDLDDDAEAFKASVAENVSRKTYSDIDRALVIRSHRDRGQRQEDVAQMLGLTERQVRNVERLLDLPKVAQEAVDDPDNAFSMTHALTLSQLAGKHEALDWDTWVGRVASEGMSVAQLKRAVNKELGAERGKEGFSGLFRESETDAKKGVFRLQPAKIEVEKLSEEERKRLKDELETVLKALG